MEVGKVAVALVNPPSLAVEDDRLEAPLGLLYLAGAARSSGYDQLRLVDMSGCRNLPQAESAIEQLPSADVYGITACCTNHEFAVRIAARARQVSPHSYVLIGGPNPSALPKRTLEETGADAVVVGEGEDAFVACLNSYREGTPIRGIAKGVGRDDIDGYAFPARDLADIASYSRKLMGDPVLSVVSSRGCQHRCMHCNSVVMGGGSPQRVRFRGVQNVVAELEALRSTTRCFRFNDDHFTARPDLDDLLRQLGGLDLIFRVFARIEDLTPRTCDALRKAGCVHVSVGLESLNADNLTVLGKGRQIGKEHYVRAAAEAGITVRAYFMVGLPFDNDTTIARDFERARGLGISEFSVYPLIPYPGSPLAREPERYGYTIVNPDFREYIQIGRNGTTCYALRHENFGPEEVERWHRQAIEILVSNGVVPTKDSVVAK